MRTYHKHKGIVKGNGSLMKKESLFLGIPFYNMFAMKKLYKRCLP